MTGASNSYLGKVGSGTRRVRAFSFPFPFSFVCFSFVTIRGERKGHNGFRRHFLAMRSHRSRACERVDSIERDLLGSGVQVDFFKGTEVPRLIELVCVSKWCTYSESSYILFTKCLHFSNSSNVQTEIIQDIF